MSDFKATKAVRKNTPLLVGVFGPSGSGKTYSALRLASGIRRVSGGDIYVIDTEADRALHYADDFEFYHVPFVEPFGPDRYLAAIKHCVDQGAKVVVVDSMSHEHEGPGGVLEMHDAIMEKMGGERHSFRAWGKPKGQRRKLINGLLQLRCNFIFCFRAKEKTSAKKDPKTGDLEKLGWMPIAGDEFVYEQTACCLLLPGADGVPTWNPEGDGARSMVKNPTQFRELFKRHAGKPLSEEMGEAMARWSIGSAPSEPERKPESGGPWRFPDGEHKGKTIAEAPTDYLTDLVAKARPSKRREEFEAEVLRRLKEETGG